MKFAITITDMDASDLAAVTQFLAARGAHPVEESHTAVPSRTVAELAAATGATLNTPKAAPAPQSAPDMSALDSRGIPYNPAFHAPSGRRNADGSWAAKKGYDKAAYQAWIDSLPAVQQAPAPARAEPVTQQAPAPVQAPVPAQPVEQPPAAAPIVDPTMTFPAAPPAPVVAEPAPDVDYQTWYAKYQELISSGKLSPEAYMDIANRYGATENPLTFFQNDRARAESYREMIALAA